MTAKINDSNSNPIPKWIEANLFEQVLKDKFNGFRNIKNFTVKPGSAAGENYATVMLRVEIDVELDDGSTKPITYMMKTCHDSDIVRAMLKSHDVFDAEKSMYEEIVPAFEKLYADAGIQVTFGPHSYNLPTTEPYILLENLCSRGFKMANRLEGLDMEYTENVLRKLAQWHAASAVYADQIGGYKDKYLYGFYREEAREMMKTMFSKLNHIFMGSIRKYSNYEVYGKEMETFSEHMIDKMFNASKINPNEFNVLNHGDCWINNIMFQHDDQGKINETYLIDYQLPKYGTPAQDLYYFLLSSTKFELKLSKFDHFIRFYHDNLYENLKVLKYAKKMPTLRDIHIALFEYGTWGLSTVSGVMAPVLLDPNENANLEHFMSDSVEGEAFKVAMYSNDRYRKHMEAILPWLLNRGAFD